MRKPTTSKSKSTSGSNFPLLLVIMLAIIMIPRVVLHDLRVIPLDSVWYKIAAVGPLVAWLGFAVFGRTRRPFYNFLLVGLCFGLLLGVTHQLLWTASWGTNPPHLGGNLAGTMSPIVEELVLRAAAFVSSLGTGLIFGMAFGLIAVAASKLRRGR
jgi:hypothetical protein